MRSTDKGRGELNQDHGGIQRARASNETLISLWLTKEDENKRQSEAVAVSVTDGGL